MAIGISIGPAWIIAAGAGCIALAALAYAQHERLSVSEQARKESMNLVKTLQTQLVAEQAARTEEQRRIDAQRNIANDAQRQIEHVQANRDAAVAAAGRLLDRLDAAGTAAQTACHPAIAAGGPPASGADMVPAELYRSLLAGARRVADRAADLADLADQRGIAGTACERAYDSLTAKP